MNQATKTNTAEDSRQFTRRAVWCGVVCSLAMLLTMLNLFPPFEVNYDVRSEVVLSSARLEQLERFLAQSQSEEAGDAKVRLTGLRVLDRSAELQGAVVDPSGETTQRDIVLVEVNSQWRGDCTGPNHRRWMETISKLNEPSYSELAGSDLAKQYRDAQWELETAKHYAQRHEYLSSFEPPASAGDGKTFQLASSSGSMPTKLASSLSASGSPGEPGSDDQAALFASIEAAQKRLTETELAWQQQIEQSSGLLEIASQPEITAHTGSVPVWMVSSILILGLATGSIAGWYQNRLQSGGVYDPAEVAEQLRLEGVPLAGVVTLPNIDALDESWLGRASEGARRTGRSASRNLIRIGEWTLGFWVVFICMRLLLDPMWRGVLYENPLSALGRAIAGLP